MFRFKLVLFLSCSVQGVTPQLFAQLNYCILMTSRYLVCCCVCSMQNHSDDAH